MKSRVGVWGPLGATFAGYLPTIGLQFSDEIGGGGTCKYSALKSDIDALGAWDTVIKIEFETSPGTWTYGPAYAVRPSYAHQGGFLTYEFTAKALLEVWAKETVLMPEYVVGTMTRNAGTERGIGWMMSAYGPLSDPYEPWNACYNTSRTTLPTGWPSGSGAKWITASGSTDETESKYFRGGISITGTAKRLVEFWLSSDESATLWVAGEKVIETNSVETGYKEFSKYQMKMYPGNYAVGIFTQTVDSKGGDGIDPVLCAAAILDINGNPTTWLTSTDAASWVACRRDDVPPNDIPPGPNPGQVLTYLTNEAVERSCTGWPNVTRTFNSTADSYGASWAHNIITERVFRYGHDTYWDIFQAMSESDDADVWMTAQPTLQLHAAPRQGQARTLTMGTTHFHSFSERGTDNERGTWTMAEFYGGWYQGAISGIRRESSLEVGQALTPPIIDKIVKASLRDSWRWDGSGNLNPPQSGWIPYLNLKLGDWVTIDYQGIGRTATITSFSATAGEGGLMWDVEFTEYLPTIVPATLVSPAQAALRGSPEPPMPGLFEGL